MDLNDTPFGLQAVAGAVIARGGTDENVVWQMANADWATLAIHLGEDYDMALGVANQSINVWQAQLNDQWNVAGLYSKGLPFITSHYGYASKPM